MALSKKQMGFVEKNKKNISAEKISKVLNIPLDEVKKYLERRTTQKAPFYFYIVIVLIPILFFVLLEAGLRIFNYGNDLSMWTEATEGKLILNAEVARRYFSTIKNLPTSIEDIFDAEKKPNAFRIFVLGESSAAGYPFMPMGSFSRYIRKRLELTYPNNKIEVINLSLTAVNSYTIRDFIHGVLEQKPDLILIYTGHNEYYGALGVGSLESLGTSRTFVNLLLYMNMFKTTQLLKDFIQFSVKIFSGEQQKLSGTLMSRMAKEQTIPLDSENYKAGIEQFKGNMQDVIETIKHANVPLIIGTLTSNLKDQEPFISVKSGKYMPAKNVFVEANTAYNSGNYKSADSLFRLAKDLDALRFRVPEEINRTIKKFEKNFQIPIVDIDSAFNASSPNGIVGNNLMTDHLHPTLQGYQLIGKIYFDKMIKMNFLPKNFPPAISLEEQEKKTVAQFPFSKLDSTIAVYRIRMLKNDWPYIDPRNKLSIQQLLLPKTFEDSLAYKFLNDELSWVECHQKAAEKYLRQKNIDGYLQHMEILIYQYPIIVEFYNHLDVSALKLLKLKEYDKAYKVLYKRYKIQPNNLSAKWLGQISLNNGDTKKAVKFLEEALRYNSEDLQTLYNLAGAYALNKEYQKSYDVITKVLMKEQNYPGAQNLINQLKVRGVFTK